MTSCSESCQCEHAAHFEKDKRTPNGNPGHQYLQRFVQVQPVRTPYGVYRVCADCARDCYAQFAPSHTEATLAVGPL